MSKFICFEMEAVKGFMYVFKAPHFVTWSWLFFTDRRQTGKQASILLAVAYACSVTPPSSLSLSITLPRHTQAGAHTHTHAHKKGCIDSEWQKLRHEPPYIHSTAGWQNINFTRTSHAELLEHKMPFRGSGDILDHRCNGSTHYRTEPSPVRVFN